MTDHRQDKPEADRQRHSEAIRGALNELNIALAAAYEAGFEVEVKLTHMNDLHVGSLDNFPILHVRILSILVCCAVQASLVLTM